MIAVRYYHSILRKSILVVRYDIRSLLRGNPSLLYGMISSPYFMDINYCGTAWYYHPVL